MGCTAGWGRGRGLRRGNKRVPINKDLLPRDGERRRKGHYLVFIHMYIEFIGQKLYTVNITNLRPTLPF